MHPRKIPAIKGHLRKINSSAIKEASPMMIQNGSKGESSRSLEKI